MTAGPMSSCLSDSKYSYDFVVATTEASINATLKAFLAQLKEPVVTVCYIAGPKDKSGKRTIVPIDHAELVKNYGTDPFAVPANIDVGASRDLENLRKARFMFGFRAQLGVPHVQDPSTLQDIVTLGTSSSSVTFNMYCSTFQVVQYTPPGGYEGDEPATWMNVSQSPSDPWVFTSKVDLRFELVDTAAYHTLPADVQKSIQNLGSGAFSIQQLLFDLANAKLQTQPDLSGNVEPGSDLDIVLRKAFFSLYFKQMQADGQPLLGCSIVAHEADTTKLKPTSLDCMVNPYLDGSGKQTGGSLTTLNYLCAVDNKTLPPPTNFSWNWVPDATAQKDHDGAISINRNTLAHYFHKELLPYVKQNCIQVWTSCVAEDATFVLKFRETLTAGQTPTVSFPATGDTVLSFSYESEHKEDAAWIVAHYRLKNNYTMTVQFTGNTIVITQHQIIYTDVRAKVHSASGNVVDKTIIDTYTLNVDANGRLVTVLTMSATDNSQNLHENAFLNFFGDLNGLIDSIKKRVGDFVGTGLKDIPVSVIQDFVFPGGKTFIFKEAEFSTNQDLVSYITYADVSGENKVVTVPANKA